MQLSSSPSDGSRPAAPYVLWGAIGLSIVVEFGVLLALQRARLVRIEDAGGALPAWLHVALAAGLFVAGAVLVARLRRARGAESRKRQLDLAAWAVGEALALVGLVLAVALQPLPRLAITIYFTGGLFLWLRSRPRSGGPSGPGGSSPVGRRTGS
jgi:hypothetical protein